MNTETESILEDQIIEEIANVIKYHFSEDVNDYIYSIIPEKTFRIGITNIQLKETQSKMLIYVTAKRPGLFMGKAGKDYNEIVNELNQKFKKEVKVFISEFKLNI